MSKFYRQSLERQALEDDKTLLKVKNLLRLIEERDYHDELITLYKIDQSLEEVVAIPGLNLLINSVISKDSQFEKFDYPTNLVDVKLVRFTESGAAILNIKTSDPNSGKEILISAETAYNAKSDYFDGVYKLDSFAKFCFKENHVKLLKGTIEYLNEHYQNAEPHRRNLRLLKDNLNDWYIRAITSTTHYNDYGIRFALFVAALTFQNLAKSHNWGFIINRAEYDESHIKVYFEKTTSHFIKGIGNIKFLIEMSNDEIKREALRFTAVYSIQTEDYEIHVKPTKLKTDIVSIQHNFSPATVFKYLSDMGEFIVKSETEIMADVNNLTKVKSPDELRYLLYRKVETAKNDEIKSQKKNILDTLTNRINTMSDLLLMMNKINLIVSDLDAKEYLRYLYYSVLQRRK